MKTTLNAIRAHQPCSEGWTKLLKHLGKTKADDAPLAITTILDSNGLDDAIWCLRAVDGCDREIRLYAVWCARQVQHLMTDPRSIAALDAAERHANNLATRLDLDAAREAAWDAAREAAWDAAREAAWDAAWASAWASAWNAAWASAWDAAWASAWNAAWASAWEAARASAWDAARDAARASAWDAQEKRLREICAEIEAAEVTR